jgi:hypothetical protein
MHPFAKKSPTPSGLPVVFKGCFTTMAAGFITIASLVGYRACSYATSEVETVRAKITQVGTVVENNNSVYMIYTDKEVFMNADDPFRRKYNSSDVHAGMVEGCTYDFNVAGKRNQRLSMYRNVITATHVPTPECPTTVAQPK